MTRIPGVRSGHVHVVVGDEPVERLLELLAAVAHGHVLVVGAEAALVLVEVLALQPVRTALLGVLDELGDETRGVVLADLLVALVAGARIGAQGIDVAAHEGAHDLGRTLRAVVAELAGRDHEPGRASLEVPRERGVEGLVEVVGAEDRHVVVAGHHPEVLRMHVPEGQHGRHPRVLAGHVAVEEQTRAAEEREQRAGELVELGLGLGVVVGDADLVVLADGLAHVHAPVVAGQHARQEHHLAAGACLGELAERLEP